MSAEVVLYPGNWLYNAGVVGFLQVLQSAGYDVESFLSRSGEVKLPDPQSFVSPTVNVGDCSISAISLQFFRESFKVLFSEKKKIDIDVNDERTVVQEIWGTLFNVHYRGFFNANSRQLFSGTKKDPRPLLVKFDEFVIGALMGAQDTGSIQCSFCQSSDVTFRHKNRFSMEHSSLLGASPSEKGMPNAFWGSELATSLRICDRCSFMILCSHLSFIPLNDGTKIFLNAPSFQVMWYLNHLFREVYGRDGTTSFREILGLSLMELALRLQVHLGVWTEMNVEVVIRRRDPGSNREAIDFFSLPYEVVQLLLDRKIAHLLSEIGETSVLRMVLDGRFGEILEAGERLLCIALKGDSKKRGRNKHEEDYIKNYIRLERNRENLEGFSSRLFSLYALIQEKLGGGER